jgi:outer membrane protein, heavy metal efflux system
MRKLSGYSLFLTLFFLFQTFALPTLADSAPALKLISLKTALELLDTHNPTLLAKQLTQQVAALDVKIAGYFPNPTLQGYVGYGGTTKVLGNPHQVSAVQTIETAGKRSKRVAVSKAEQELTAVQYAKLRWQLRADVRQTYAEITADEERLNFMTAQISLLERLVTISEKRVKAGVAAEVELLQTRLRRDSLAKEGHEALHKIEEDKIRLNTLLGNALDSDFEIEDKGLFQATVNKTLLAPDPSQPLPSIETLTSLADQNQMDVLEAQKNLRVLGKQLKLEKAQSIPDIDISTGYLFIPLAAQYSPTATSNIFEGGYTQFSLTLPLYHNHKNEISRLKLLLKEQGLSLEGTQLQVKQDMRLAYMALEHAQHTIELFQEKLLPQAKEVLHLAQRSYEVGKSDLTSVILSEQNTQQLVSEYIQNISAYQYAWAELERITGKDLNP